MLHFYTHLFSERVPQTLLGMGISISIWDQLGISISIGYFDFNWVSQPIAISIWAGPNQVAPPLTSCSKQAKRKHT